MQFIDRVKEQRRLKEALSSDAPAFIVLFGRRRLGKSTLIRNVLNEKDVYYEQVRANKLRKSSFYQRQLR